jgi:hypothetical protein
MTSTTFYPGVRPDARTIRWARAWMWGLFASFLANDGEEAAHIVLRGGLYQGERLDLTVSQALSGMLFLLTVGWLVVLGAVRDTRPGWPVWICAGLIAGDTLHGVWHLVTGLRGDGYAMGVITALPACVVYGVLALRRLYGDGLLTRRTLPLCVLGGLVTAGPLVLLAHLFGRLVG